MLVSRLPLLFILTLPAPYPQQRENLGMWKLPVLLRSLVVYCFDQMTLLDVVDQFADTIQPFSPP